MVFAHDAEIAMQAAVDLANSALEPDSLTTIEDLDAFYRRWGYTGRQTGDDDELSEVRALRPGLLELLGADRDEAVGIVNRWLAEADAVPRLVRHGDVDWHIHATEDDKPLATRILVETAMAMIDVIRADEMSRLSICADQDCSGIVLDLSRNRSRRFCSTTCGNRNAVAAYRARKSENG